MQWTKIGHRGSIAISQMLTNKDIERMEEERRRAEEEKELVEKNLKMMIEDISIPIDQIKRSPSAQTTIAVPIKIL